MVFLLPLSHFPPWGKECSLPLGFRSFLPFLVSTSSKKWTQGGVGGSQWAVVVFLVFFDTNSWANTDWPLTILSPQQALKYWISRGGTNVSSLGPSQSMVSCLTSSSPPQLLYSVEYPMGSGCWSFFTQQLASFVAAIMMAQAQLIFVVLLWPTRNSHSHQSRSDS